MPGKASSTSWRELADLLIRLGANTGHDLRQLWRRIVFSVCVSNTDDHLRNHGFTLTRTGWLLAPAYDLNPNRFGHGLTLNISESDNAQSLDLAREVAPYFRVTEVQAREVVSEVVAAVRTWPEVATARGLSHAAQDRMREAFRVATSAKQAG